MRRSRFDIGTLGHTACEFGLGLGGTWLAPACWMTLRPFLTLFVLGALASACGGSAKTDGSGGAGGSGAGGGGGATTGGSGGTGGCESLVPCCDGAGNPVSPVCDATGMPVCPPGAAFPASGVCSAGQCSPTVPCAAGEYCDYPDDRCGQGMAGTCKPKPTGCDLLYAPVCSCDGSVAGNACAAMAGGTDVNKNGGCTPPMDTFACGDVFCAFGSEYCLRGVSDVGGEPDSYGCKPLPAQCQSCSCVANGPCGDWCEAAADGSLTLTCPGG